MNEKVYPCVLRAALEVLNRENTQQETREWLKALIGTIKEAENERKKIMI